MGLWVDDDRFERVAALMERMGTGDRAAVFELADEFGADLRSTMAGHLRTFGARLGWVDLDGVVLDAAIVLFDLARGWRREMGVPPWRWARHQLRALAAAHAGLVAVEPTDDDVGLSVEPGVVDLLAALAARHEGVALVADALAAVSTRRDQAIVLELELQRSLGDQSPATTVGRLHGLAPAAVRQVRSRVRRRLRALAAADTRYAGLMGLPLVA